MLMHQDQGWGAVTRIRGGWEVNEGVKKKWMCGAMAWPLVLLALCFF